MKMKEWSGYAKYLVLADRDKSRLIPEYNAYLEFGKVIDALQVISRTQSKTYLYEGEVVKKPITPSKAADALVKIEKCQYDQNVEVVAISLGIDVLNTSKSFITGNR